MKTIKLNYVTIVLFLLALCNKSLGQENISLSTLQKVNFQAESNVKEVKIEVSKEFNFLRIDVQSKFHDGDVLVSILDPNGKLKESFTIKAEKKNPKESLIKNESYSAKMIKRYRNPISGLWLVQIKPLKKSSGQTLVQATVLFNARADLLELDQIEEDLRDRTN